MYRFKNEYSIVRYNYGYINRVKQRSRWIGDNLRAVYKLLVLYACMSMAIVAMLWYGTVSILSMQARYYKYT